MAPAALARRTIRAPDEGCQCLLHPPLPSAGVSIVMERGWQGVREDRGRIERVLQRGHRAGLGACGPRHAHQIRGD